MYRPIEISQVSLDDRLACCLILYMITLSRKWVNDRKPGEVKIRYISRDKSHAVRQCCRSNHRIAHGGRASNCNTITKKGTPSIRNCKIEIHEMAAKGWYHAVVNP